MPRPLPGRPARHRPHSLDWRWCFLRWTSRSLANIRQAPDLLRCCSLCLPETNSQEARLQSTPWHKSSSHLPKRDGNQRLLRQGSQRGCRRSCRAPPILRTDCSYLFQGWTKGCAKQVLCIARGQHQAGIYWPGRSNLCIPIGRHTSPLRWTHRPSKCSQPWILRDEWEPQVPSQISWHLALWAFLSKAAWSSQSALCGRKRPS